MYLYCPSLWPLFTHVKSFPAPVGAQGEKLPGSITMPSRGNRYLLSVGKCHTIVPMSAVRCARSGSTRIIPPTIVTLISLLFAAPDEILSLIISTQLHNAREIAI